MYDKKLMFVTILIFLVYIITNKKFYKILNDFFSKTNNVNVITQTNQNNDYSFSEIYDKVVKSKEGVRTW